MRKYCLLGYALLFFIQILPAQQDMTSFQKISLSSLQMDEGLNYGLVFNGPGFQYAYGLQWDYSRHVLRYMVEGGFNYMESRDIGAGNIHIIPLQLSYLFIVNPKKTIQAGPFLVAEYNYTLYPDLQSGYSFWMTHFSLGGELYIPFSVAEQPFNARLQTSLAGFISRPPVSRDEYFFNLSAGDAISDLHSDLAFGSWDTYSVSSLELQWRPKPESHLSLAYAFQYSGYYQEPTLTMMNHALKLVIHPRSKVPSQ